MGTNKLKTRGLGKGLEALFNEVSISSSNNEEEREQISPDKGIFYIDVHKIKPNAEQPRKTFDREGIEELAKSIENHGLIQPIVVTKSGNGYQIVAGERRWRAAQSAKMKEIPCIIRDLTPEQNMLLALIENMQREDLNPIDEALAIERMIADFQMTQEEISRSIGKSRPYVTNAIRLLKLPEEVQNMIVAGEISGGHGRVIAGIKDGSKQLQAAKYAVEKGWSVREMEAFAGEEKKTVRPKARSKNREVMDIEDELGRIFGTKVSLSFGPKKGKIEIEYYSKDELDRLIELVRGL
ncbi:MAG: ParB/RepB/Spo0J family partition protein [Anaerovoracaceae bacterium]|jgi:ParB family chromosome partitioning protein